MNKILNKKGIEERSHENMMFYEEGDGARAYQPQFMPAWLAPGGQISDRTAPSAVLTLTSTSALKLLPASEFVLSCHVFCFIFSLHKTAASGLLVITASTPQLNISSMFSGASTVHTFTATPNSWQRETVSGKAAIIE